MLNSQIFNIVKYNKDFSMNKKTPTRKCKSDVSHTYQRKNQSSHRTYIFPITLNNKNTRKILPQTTNKKV